MKANNKNQSLSQNQQHPDSVSRSPNPSLISSGTPLQPPSNRYISLKYSLDTSFTPQTHHPEASIPIIILALLYYLL